MNELPREMVWKVEPKVKKAPTTAVLKKEMNDLKKEFNKLSQFLVQNLVDMEAQLALLKQENEQLRDKLNVSQETTKEVVSKPNVSFLPAIQLPALSTTMLM